MDLSDYGPRIAAWRVARDLTQSQLAERAGVARTTLAAIERGAPSWQRRTIEALCVALDLAPEDLARLTPVERAVAAVSRP